MKTTTIFWSFLLSWLKAQSFKPFSPTCVKIKYAFTKIMEVDSANGDGQVFLATDKNQLIIVGGDGQTRDNGPLLEVGYLENDDFATGKNNDFFGLPNNLTAMVRNPMNPDNYYGFSKCMIGEYKFDRENTKFEVVKNMMDNQNFDRDGILKLPCPIDAALYFKQQILVFRGCSLWSEKGEVTHLHNIGLPCNIDAIFTLKDKSSKTGRTIVRIFAIKDNRIWKTTVKVKNQYPDFTNSEIGNINFDLDICSVSFCEKDVYASKYGLVHDSDIFDPYDVQELFSGDESEQDYDYNYQQDGEHIGPVGIYGPKISENKLFLEKHIYKPVPNLNGKTRCNGDSRFCRLRYNQVTFAGSHNSASGADYRFRQDDFTERCNIADQTSSLDQQLQDGIRFFEFSPCKKGCPLYRNLRASKTRPFSPFRSFQSPILRNEFGSNGKGKSGSHINRQSFPKYNNWPGFCTKNRCTMPLCRAIKIFKRWNSIHPTEVVTLYFGPENYGQGADSPTLDAYDWEHYMKFVTRYISNQMPNQLNTHRLERSEWPFIETMKPIFVFLNDRDLDNTKTRIFRENPWLHRQSSYLTSTHMSRGVTGTCEHVIIDSGVQCRLKPMYELLTLAIYGTYGLCTLDRARYCNQYLLESSDQCLKYRSEFGRTINFITTDHTTNKARFPETTVATAFHINLYNLLQFNPESCKAVSPDAALRWTGDQRIYFFKDKKIHRYEETAQTVDHVFEMKIDGLEKIDAALTQNDTTLFFRGCDLWEYKVTYPDNNDSKINNNFGRSQQQDTYFNAGQSNYYQEPQWKLSKVMKIQDRYPGLPCDLDAAISMYGRQYFFKGCLYYEVTTEFNKKKSKETQWNQGHEGGFKKTSGGIFWGC